MNKILKHVVEHVKQISAKNNIIQEHKHRKQ